ncbi:ISC1058 family transposase [Saccharolobus shibatae]|uniref:ISC1058 family transposase n=1 Tax=Saccharolobus shibatae TaxID=2286 RepID=A0A8F5GZS4_9CREN|nr:ISC1058 family transposase [Saccharolobus shibatae]
MRREYSFCQYKIWPVKPLNSFIPNISTKLITLLLLCKYYEKDYETYDVNEVYKTGVEVVAPPRKDASTRYSQNHLIKYNNYGLINVYHLIYDKIYQKEMILSEFS